MLRESSRDERADLSEVMNISNKLYNRPATGIKHKNPSSMSIEDRSDETAHL